MRTCKDFSWPPLTWPKAYKRIVITFKLSLSPVTLNFTKCQLFIYFLSFNILFHEFIISCVLIHRSMCKVNTIKKNCFSFLSMSIRHWIQVKKLIILVRLHNKVDQMEEVCFLSMYEEATCILTCKKNKKFRFSSSLY